MNKTKDITLLGIMTALIIVMLAIPGLGFIPLPHMNATIVHIPVIIIAIIKGPKMGSLLGLIFGIASLINALLRPNITSFMFINPLVSILPRILIGLVTGIIFNKLYDKNSNNLLSLGIASGIGSFVNTIGVLGMIFIIYQDQYLQVRNLVGQSPIKILLTIAFTQGLIEMLIAIIISSAISKILLRFEKRGNYDTNNRHR